MSDLSSGSMSSMLISPGRPDSDRNTLRMPSTSNRASENFLKPSWSRQMRRAASMSLTNTPMWLMRFSMNPAVPPPPGSRQRRGRDHFPAVLNRAVALLVQARHSRVHPAQLTDDFSVPLTPHSVGARLSHPEGVRRGFSCLSGAKTREPYSDPV